VDTGVRRVVVGVSGSPGSLHALRRAVVEARRCEALLCSVLTWTPQGGELTAGRARNDHRSSSWENDPVRRLRAAWDDALGGVPFDLDVCLLAMRGPAGPHLVRVADREHDLLVVGAGHAGPLRRLVAGSVARYCVLHARSCVLVVPPSALDRELRQHRLATRRLVRDLSRQRVAPPPR
jgi:nucleotide-binding universal stress UspA family protein